MSKQIKTFKRKTKLWGLLIESWDEFDERINKFCDDNNVYSLIPLESDSHYKVIVIYEKKV